MSSETRRELTPCGCCETASLETERSIKPGQPALPYRVDTHSTFLRRMLYRLHTTEISDGENAGDRPLESISTQTENDPLVGILDAWACVGDVLTFYQERIANEGYLRTATERRSVLELARAIGYELSPGVAASTHLAFKVDDAEGRPGVATIPQGTQVQSLPEQGESPVTYETDDEIEAYAAWNEMVARTRENQVITREMLQDDDITLYLTGVGLDLEPGDYFAVFSYETPTEEAEESEDEEASETPVVTAVAAFVITRVVENLEESYTVIEGENLVIQLDEEGEEETQNPTAMAPPALDVGTGSYDWILDVDPTSSDFVLSDTVFDAGSFGKEYVGSSFGVFAKSNWWDLSILIDAAETVRTRLQDPGGQVHVFRDRVGFFGHNAPRHGALPVEQRETTWRWDSSNWIPTSPAYPEPWDPTSSDEEPPTIWVESQEESSTRPLYKTNLGSDAFLERTVEGIVKGTLVLLEVADANATAGDSAEEGEDEPSPTNSAYRRLFYVEEVSEETLADYGLSAKCTGISLGFVPADKSTVLDPADRFKVRRTAAHVRSEQLELTPEKPLDTAQKNPCDVVYEDESKAESTCLTLQGAYSGLCEDRLVALRGESTSFPGVTRGEILSLDADCIVSLSGGYTLLRFKSGLEDGYVRDTVTVNANVVPATHGEAVSETLGSGDGATPNQTFRLAKPPLTYTPAETETGSETTLEVRVDGILWDEAPFHYGLGPTDRAYTVRIDNEARSHVIFGDGRQGARLPTGASNVAAVYRSGIGLEGELDEERLTLLKTKPPEVREVTNPVVAAGAEDPETLDFARRNAPLKVKTLDRVVSLQDYEDFARTFAGIGKARASVIWNGAEEVVHITVGSSSGGTTTSEQNERLRDAIEGVRDPREPVEVDGYDPVWFRIAAKVKIDEAYLWETVKAEIDATLVDAFSFEERAFGQPVTSAEVITRIHRVDGVIAVDLDELHAFDDSSVAIPPVRSDILAARRAVYSKETGEALPSQLLLLEEAELEITEMTT